MDTQEDKSVDLKRKYRIQFDVDEELFLRAKRYFRDNKNRHFFGLQAFEERINRLEGRDKRLQEERIQSDVEYMQSLIDSGKLQIRKEILR
jgi:hypothetical protein